MERRKLILFIVALFGSILLNAQGVITNTNTAIKIVYGGETTTINKQGLSISNLIGNTVRFVQGGKTIYTIEYSAVSTPSTANITALVDTLGYWVGLFNATNADSLGGFPPSYYLANNNGLDSIDSLYLPVSLGDTFITSGFTWNNSGAGVNGSNTQVSFNVEQINAADIFTLKSSASIDGITNNYAGYFENITDDATDTSFAVKSLSSNSSGVALFGKIQDDNTQIGRVLTCVDSEGTATWQDASGGCIDSTRSVIVKRYYSTDTVFYGTVAQRGLDAMDSAITYCQTNDYDKIITYADSLVCGINWSLASYGKATYIYVYGTKVIGGTVFTSTLITDDYDIELRGTGNFYLTGNLIFIDPTGGDQRRLANDYIEVNYAESSGNSVINYVGTYSGNATFKGEFYSSANDAIIVYGLGNTYKFIDVIATSTSASAVDWSRGDLYGNMISCVGTTIGLDINQSYSNINLHINYAYGSDYSIYSGYAEANITANYLNGGFYFSGGIAYHTNITANVIDNCYILNKYNSNSNLPILNIKANTINDLFITSTSSSGAGEININAQDIYLKDANYPIFGSYAVIYYPKITIDFNNMYANANYIIADIDDGAKITLNGGNLLLTGTITSSSPRLLLGDASYSSTSLIMNNVKVIDNTSYSAGTKYPLITYNATPYAYLEMNNCNISLKNGTSIIKVANDGVFNDKGNIFICDTNYYPIEVEANDTLTRYNYRETWVNTYLPSSTNSGINLNSTGYINNRMVSGAGILEDNEIYNLINK